jgi:hypothetical protein
MNEGSRRGAHRDVGLPRVAEKKPLDPIDNVAQAAEHYRYIAAEQRNRDADAHAARIAKRKDTR